MFRFGRILKRFNSTILNLVLVTLLGFIILLHISENNTIRGNQVLIPTKDNLMTVGKTTVSKDSSIKWTSKNSAYLKCGSRPWTEGHESVPSMPPACHTAGCYSKKEYQGFKLFCEKAVKINSTTPLGAARKAFYRHQHRLHAMCANRLKIKLGNWQACQVPGVEIKPSCLVYSFGINNDWTFDQAALDIGCEVKSIDPTIGLSDSKMGERHWFYNVGLDGENHVIQYKRNKAFTAKTFKTLLESNGDQDKIIDYLKFDVEYAEWSTILDMITHGNLQKVKQLAFETHAYKDTVTDYMYYLSAMQAIENIGFQRWQIGIVEQDSRCHKTEEGGRRCPQSHMHFINTAYVKDLLK